MNLLYSTIDTERKGTALQTAILNSQPLEDVVQTLQDAMQIVAKA